MDCCWQAATHRALLLHPTPGFDFLLSAHNRVVHLSTCFSPDPPLLLVCLSLARRGSATPVAAFQLIQLMAPPLHLNLMSGARIRQHPPPTTQSVFLFTHF